MSEIRDEDLTAYLDGELSAEETEQIKAAVAASPELEARLSALEIPKDDIRKVFDGMLAVAPPAPVMPEPAANHWPRLSAVAAAVAVGVGLGALMFREAPQDWTMAVANYQSLYVTETLAAPPLPVDQAQLVVAGLSGRLGVDLTPLIDLSQIEFRRAQMLGIEGEPLVQMAYLAGGAVPVAICITPVSGGDSGVTVSRMFGMEAASWTQDGHGYLVIGGDDSALIRQVADDVRSAI